MRRSPKKHEHKRLRSIQPLGSPPQAALGALLISRGLAGCVVPRDREIPRSPRLGCPKRSPTSGLSRCKKGELRPGRRERAATSKVIKDDRPLSLSNNRTRPSALDHNAFRCFLHFAHLHVERQRFSCKRRATGRLIGPLELSLQARGRLWCCPSTPETIRIVSIAEGRYVERDPPVAM